MHPPSLIPSSHTGLPGEEERSVAFSDNFQSKKLENWDEHNILNHHSPIVDVIKQEVSQSGNYLLYSHGHGHEEFQVSGSTAWSHMVPVSSSPRSSVTTSFSSNSNNLLDFTYNKAPADHRKNQLPDHISECNSKGSGGVCKKTSRGLPSSSQPPLKVRKEKLGDRITALHQLVSPFGKTDTASVLLEAIGYIRFLQGQIEALSSPYLGNGSKNMRNQHSVHGERNSVFPEDPGQLLNDGSLKRKGAPNQDIGKEKEAQDLRSRGLCLVPVSCTQHVGNETGADYWAPAYGTGF
ncbi:Myc-type, basic helix-loop-helix [Sesbania bispinosa]|nr:Myc-type, basic helix-loop-helix [Sesbania bispinosa]